ncbi:MAG TPA: hypothetical protein VJ957_08615, partial [Longimicrobiales bacterium]|nr:hypothetical protein [Longimicrobiales bacterium]
FTDASRISVSTGLPTILGWPGHEYMVRGQVADPVIKRRFRDMVAIYMTPDTAELRSLLDRYHVRYVYLGNVERSVFPGVADSTALHTLPLAYAHGPVRIYRAARTPAPEHGRPLRCVRPDAAAP